jgi:hypothetical protein
MKKGLAIFILLCLLIGSWVSIGLAAGSWTSSSYNAPKNTVIKTISLTFTADSGDATIPVYTFTAADLAFVTGYYLYVVETDPGATGPTNGAWDVTIKDANGYEILGNSCDDLNNTATQVNFPKLDGTNFGYPVMDGTAVTITIEGNLVVSATATIKLYFVRQ